METIDKVEIEVEGSGGGLRDHLGYTSPALQERKLMTAYNKKPVISKPQHELHLGEHYVMIDLDIYQFKNDTSLRVHEQMNRVLEIRLDGPDFPKPIRRCQLPQLSGLCPRHRRSVNTSLFLINSSPSLLVRKHVLRLNFGAVRAITMPDRILFFYRQYRDTSNCSSLVLQLALCCMLVSTDIANSTLMSCIRRPHQWVAVEPRVSKLLDLSPSRLTPEFPNELRLSDQSLVELSSRISVLTHMLVDLLNDHYEMKQICDMGLTGCVLCRGEDVHIEFSTATEKQVAEEEIEKRFGNYLQCCVSCRGLAERLLDTTRELKDSIVNLSSRGLEVSIVKLLLRVGIFCVVICVLVAGIFGINPKSYPKEHALAICLATVVIVVCAIAAFFMCHNPNREFGPKRKEHIQYCMDHPEVIHCFFMSAAGRGELVSL